MAARAGVTRRFGMVWGLAAMIALIAAFALIVVFPGGSLRGLVGAERVRLALGFGENCVRCHQGSSGLDGPHSPDRIGCAACHAGDPEAEGKEAAHVGMIRVPGNLADAQRSCGSAGCHDALVPRVRQSIMTTMAGVIAVNRAVLGEPGPEETMLPDASRLGHGVADSHLRELCVGCHLGQAKTEWGPVNEDSWGGGCNACHLEYGPEALAQLTVYQARVKAAAAAAAPLTAVAPVTAVTPVAAVTPAAAVTVAKVASNGPALVAPTAHPTLTVNPRNEHCFGCHSRSGRIALSYEGWHETGAKTGEGMAGGRRIAGRDEIGRDRELIDGRVLQQVIPDIHHDRGLECIDCHIASELMGTGTVVASKAQQLRVGCEDCHTRTPATVATEYLDPESLKLLALRNWTLGPGQHVGTTRDGAPIVNLRVDSSGRAWLLRKRTSESLALRPPAPACDAAAHRRLACGTCHTAWAPRCIACHTRFDPADEGFDHAAQAWVKGTWNETAGPFEATLPTLGVTAETAARGAIDTFVPGMIMSFDRNMAPGGKPDLVFRRLYAKLFPHTIRRETRSCTSCHSDPVALGYGKGALRYVATTTGGKWRFTPAARASPHDGLPEDAWTGFLKERSGMVSTRAGARPFSVAEQHRILRVGACLTCHAGDTPVMQDALRDFDATLARRSGHCVVPTAERRI